MIRFNNIKVIVSLVFSMLLTLSGVAQEDYYVKHLSKGKLYFSQVPPEYVQALKEFELAKNQLRPSLHMQMF